MRVRLRLAFVLAIGCTASVAVDDAGLDGGPDAGRDAARADAGRDAGRDAGPDAGPAAWERLPGFADDCYFERALDPSAFSVGEWSPCPDGMAGCLVLDWNDAFPHIEPYASAAYHDGSRGYFVVWEAAAATSPIGSALVVDSDLSTISAWRDVGSSLGTCLLHIGLDDGHAGLMLSAISDDDPPSSRYRLYHAPLVEIAGMTEPSLTLTGDEVLPTNFVDALSVSATTVALRFAPSARVYVVEGSRYSVTAVADEGIAVEPIAVGHDVLYTSWYQFRGDESRIVHAALDAPQALLYYEPGTILTDLSTDGRDMVWLRITARDAGGTYTESEYWTAPFTADAAAIAPRQVGPRSGVTLNATVGEGLVAYTWVDRITYEHHIEVMDLADGSRRGYVLPLAPRRWWVRGPLWVTREEIAVGARGHAEETILRIQLSAFTPL